MKKNIFKDDYNLKSLLKIKTKTGNLPMYVTPRYRLHYLKNKYEPFSVTVIRNLIKPKNTFLDIGAHYGFFSLVVHQQQPSTNIIAIEAVKKNCQVLEKNFKLNSIKNYTVHCQAVSAKKESKNFFITNASDSSGFSPHSQAKAIRKKQIITATVDHLVKNLTIDLIKIDVEGHELAVIRGGQNTIKKFHCPLIIEFNPSCQLLAGHSPQQLLKLLDKLGYNLFVIGENTQKLYLIDTPINNWINIIGVDNFFKRSTYFNLLCLKKNTYQKNSFIKKNLRLISKSMNQNYIFKKLYQQQQNEARLHLEFRKQYNLIRKELTKTQQEYDKTRKLLFFTQKKLDKTYKAYLNLINQPQK